MRAGDFFRALGESPIATIADLTGGEPFVVVAPHPDDETLGCAGLMSDACARRITMRLVVVTDGSASHPGSKSYPPPRLAARRRGESLAAAGVCGVPGQWIRFLGLRDGTVPLRGEIFDAAAAAVESVIEEVQARSVFVTWRDDPHSDHEAVHDIARAAAVRLGLRLWTYPIWGWVLPAEQAVAKSGGLRLDISRWRERKAQAVACHLSQTTRLIDDVPEGFLLTPDMLARFQGPYEYFVEAAT